MRVPLAITAARPSRLLRAGLAVLLPVLAVAVLGGQGPTPGSAPGARVLLDAHNCYPEQGQWRDRIDRALGTGVPVAIEQDLVWRPAESGQPGRSVVAHGGPFTGDEPGLREHFFERIRPIVERALAAGPTSDWPLVVLNLDFKTNEPEHHAAVWQLLGDYEPWLSTAVKGRPGDRPSPIHVGPVLVLTGEDDTQETSFSRAVPVGGTLRLFGAVSLSADRWATSAGLADAAPDERAAAFWRALPSMPLPGATDYRRWWNNPWSVVEAGGPTKAGDWTREDEQRLATLVRRAHTEGLWIRFYTLDGFAAGEGQGWSATYNFGSRAAAEERWRAVVRAGVDFVATDQYEPFAALVRQARP